MIQTPHAVAVQLVSAHLSLHRRITGGATWLKKRMDSETIYALS